MRYWRLFIIFMKIGAFSFGGGYAMIPFFEKEIQSQGWTAAADYTKVIAIAQVFPGPFAVDSSAYIGFKVGGILGAVIATIGLCLPSFLALVYITKRYLAFKSNQYLQMLLTGARPVVIGLLISATYIIGFQPLLGSWENLTAHAGMGAKVVLLTGAGFLALKITKMNPIWFIMLFGMVGMALF